MISGKFLLFCACAIFMNRQNMERMDSKDVQNMDDFEESNPYSENDKKIGIYTEIDEFHNKLNPVIDGYIRYISSLDKDGSHTNTIRVLNDLKDRNVNFPAVYVDKLLQFICNKPDIIYLEAKHKQIIFHVLALYAHAYPYRQICMAFLDNIGNWVLDSHVHAFLYKISDISDTRFPDSEVIEIIRDAKIGAQGINSQYEAVLTGIMSFMDCKMKSPNINIEDTNFYRRVTDLKNYINNEETMTVDIIVYMTCAGIPTMRNIALKKIINFLNNIKLVKMISQLISVIIFNLDPENIPLDSENVKILMTLKVKPTFENLINNILYCFFLNYPEQINCIVKILLNLTKESNMTCINRMITITRLLFNSNIQTAMRVLVDLWYSCDEKNEIYISNCFRESEYFHLISTFLTFLYESYDYHLPLPVFLIRISRTTITLILEAYNNFLEKNKPANSILIHSDNTKINEKLSLILYGSRNLYLSFMKNIIYNNKNNEKVNMAFCEGLLTVFFLKPISYYIFTPAQNNTSRFIKNYISFFILSENSFFFEMIDFLYDSKIFYNNIGQILEILNKLFDLLIDYQNEFKVIVKFIEILVINDFIYKLYRIGSSEVVGKADRIIEVAHLENILLIYIKIFILNPSIVSNIIFENFVSVKYLILKIAIRNIDIKIYVDFEGVSLIDESQQNLNISNSSHKNCFIFDLRQSLIDFPIKDKFEVYSKDSRLLEILNECACFSVFMEKLWVFALENADNDPYEIYKYLTFLPDFINFKRLSLLQKIPKIILIAYLTLNYYRSFFIEDKSINQTIIEYLLKNEDTKIFNLLTSMLNYSIVSSPTLILLFLLSSKSTASNDYLSDGGHLDYPTNEVRIISYTNLIFKAITCALNDETSTTITINLLKMLKIISPNETNIFLSNWIISKYKMVKLLISKYNSFDLIFEIFQKNDSNYNDEKYSFSILLLLSSVQENQRNQNYINLRDNLLSEPILHFSLELLNSSPDFINIPKTSDKLILEFFITRSLSDDPINFRLKFLFRCLQCSYYSLPTSILLLEKISQLISINPDKIPTDDIDNFQNILKRVIKIHKNNIKQSILSILSSYFNIISPEKENMPKINIEKISNKIVQENMLKKQKNIEIDKEIIVNESCGNVTAEINNIRIISHLGSEKNAQNLNAYSKIGRLIKENPLEAVFLIANCTSEITHLVSYRELVDFLIDISNLYDDSLISFSGDILKVIRCLISHPQLYLNQRQVNLTYDVIDKYLSLGDKFYVLLCQCLIFETSQDSEDQISKLNSDYFLWIHVLNKIPIEDFEQYVIKFSACSFPISECRQSVQNLVLFLHLNCPRIFDYKLEFSPTKITKFKDIYSSFQKTVCDEFILRVIQNSFEFIITDSPSIASSLRFLYFCKIFKLYPMLIFRHLSFFLSCLNSSLKTLSFLKSSKNRPRIENVLVFYDIFTAIAGNELSEEDIAHASKINTLFDTVISKDANMNINVYNIDYLLLSFSHLDENHYVFKVPEISPHEIAFWLINHPVQEICQLKKQLFTLGNNLDYFYRIETSKMSFIKSLLPMVIIVPQFWQNRIVENIMMSDSQFDNDDILNLLTKHQDLFSIFEDYYNSFSYRL